MTDRTVDVTPDPSPVAYRDYTPVSPELLDVLMPRPTRHEVMPAGRPTVVIHNLVVQHLTIQASGLAAPEPIPPDVVPELEPVTYTQPVREDEPNHSRVRQWFVHEGGVVWLGVVACVGVAAVVVVTVLQAITAMVAAIAMYAGIGLAAVVIVLVLLALGGTAKCAGLHCGGCGG